LQKGQKIGRFNFTTTTDHLGLIPDHRPNRPYYSRGYPGEEIAMPKIYLQKNKDEIPEVGDKYEVMGVFPGTTDDLMRPRIEVYVRLMTEYKKKKQKKTADER
jgi:hypothetical protein